MASNAALAADGDSSTAIASLQRADYGQRADFARFALDEVIDSYEGAVLGAETPGKSAPDLRRWRAATNAFVSQLQQARWRLERGADVQLTTESDGTVVMFIDRQPVLLSGPDGTGSHHLQQAVLRRYCERYACAATTEPGSGGQSTASAGPAPGESQWSFAQDRRPSFITAEGMRFVYANIEGRAAKERLSRQLEAELQSVARALKAAARSRTQLDWRHLRLEARRGGGLEQLVLTRLGGRMSLSAPLLASAPPLWREALPWLRAQVEDRRYPLTLWQADSLLAPAAAEPGQAWYGAGR